MFAQLFSDSFDKQKAAFNFTNHSARNYWEFMKQSSQDFLSFFIITVSILLSFRFYFSLKATRVFGPFTKLIKLNAVALSQWLLFMLLLLLIASSFFYTLLSQNNACSGLYSCSKGLIEATVGRTDFTKNDNNWSAHIALMAVSYVLAAVLTNMVVAKMNSAYVEVQR